MMHRTQHVLSFGLACCLFSTCAESLEFEEDKWACDPVAQDCGDDLQCIVPGGEPKCAPLNQFQIGEDLECMEGRGCAPGLTCVAWAWGTVCTRLCFRDSDCNPDKYCGSKLAENEEIGLCYPKPIVCDWRIDGVCEGIWVCGFTRDLDNQAIMGCVIGGELDVGQPCRDVSGYCKSGTVCTKGDSQVYTCHQLCDDSDTQNPHKDCPPDFLCTPLGAYAEYDVAICLD